MSKYPVYADYDGSPVVIVADGYVGYIYGGGAWHEADAHAASLSNLHNARTRNGVLSATKEPTT